VLVNSGGGSSYLRFLVNVAILIKGLEFNSETFAILKAGHGNFISAEIVLNARPCTTI
jgi:hypothetical protein